MEDDIDSLLELEPAELDEEYDETYDAAADSTLEHAKALKEDEEAQDRFDVEREKPQQRKAKDGTAPEIHGLRGALTEERQKRQTLEGQIAELTQTLQRMQQPAPAQAPPEKPVDFMDNPKAYIEQREQLIAQHLAMQNQQMQQLHMAQTQQMYQARFGQLVNESETSFAQQAPDYYDALDYLRSLETERFKAYNVPAEQIAANVQRSILGAAESALRQGLNPAEVVYKIANNYGFGARQHIAQIEAGQRKGKGASASGPAKELSVEEGDPSDIGRLIAELNKM